MRYRSSKPSFPLQIYFWYSFLRLSTTDADGERREHDLAGSRSICKHSDAATAIMPLFTVYRVLWRTIELKETEPKKGFGP
jgi:hypothetical protein